MGGDGAAEDGGGGLGVDGKIDRLVDEPGGFRKFFGERFLEAGARGGTRLAEEEGEAGSITERSGKAGEGVEGGVAGFLDAVEGATHGAIGIVKAQDAGEGERIDAAIGAGKVRVALDLGGAAVARLDDERDGSPTGGQGGGEILRGAVDVIHRHLGERIDILDGGGGNRLLQGPPGGRRRT